MRIRPGEPRDERSLARMRCALWPDEAASESRAAARALLAGRPPGVLPAAVMVAEVGGEVVGFAEVALRSYVDGCAPDRPAGYLEGWYVEPEHRRQGLGRRLVEAACDWCRAHGCIEMGSDTWADNPVSQQAHRALGFEEVDRCVNYRLSIASATGTGGAFYGTDLAALHHTHYGHVARHAAGELLRRLAAGGFDRGLVVDLAAGSGILSRRVVDAGFRAYGVDLSAAMVTLARDRVPGGIFVEGSLWTADLPADPDGIVAVAAIGEAFSYATDPTAGLDGLRRRLASVHRALVPGGLLLFDVPGPGRSGPAGFRERSIRHGGTVLHLTEREEAAVLTRDITLFLPLGRLYRRVDETHRLILYEPGDVGAVLTELGFVWERLPAYGETAFPPGWHGFAATKG